MAFVLAIERVFFHDPFNVCLLADHDMNPPAEFCLDGVFDRPDQLCFGGFLCVEGQVAAIDIAHDILKTEFGKHGLEFDHFYQISPADVNAPKQCDVSHLEIILALPESKPLPGIDRVEKGETNCLAFFAYCVTSLGHRVHIDHKSIPYVGFDRPVIRLFDTAWVDDLDVGDDVVFGTKVQHLLRFRNAANK